VGQRNPASAAIGGMGKKIADFHRDPTLSKGARDRELPALENMNACGPAGAPRVPYWFDVVVA
jgi:hypothetical protein